MDLVSGHFPPKIWISDIIYLPKPGLFNCLYSNICAGDYSGHYAEQWSSFVLVIILVIKVILVMSIDGRYESKVDYGRLNFA